MADFATLVLAQIKLYNRIKDNIANFKKQTRNQVTKGGIDARIMFLDSLWHKYETNDETLQGLFTDANKSHEYFSNEKYSLDSAEELLFLEKGKLLELKNELSAPIADVSGVHDGTAVFQTSVTKSNLPKLPLPTFDGNLKNWIEFRNSFYLMVVKSDRKAPEQLTFLKSALSGDPLFLIKNINVSETDNFETKVWKKLTDYYDNNRTIIYAYVDSLLTLPTMNEESAAQLRKLLNETNDHIDSLLGLGCPVSQWDHILVRLTVNRLDRVTRRDWEDSLGDSTTPATYEQLAAFLLKRLHTLETMGSTLSQGTKGDNFKGRKTNNANNNNNSNKSSNKGSNAIKTHNSTTGSGSALTCSCCSGSHFVVSCTDFRSKSPSQRYEIVKAKRLCYNCLGSHESRQCKNQKRCSICSQRHHTLIHDAINTPPDSSLQTRTPADQSTSNQVTATHPSTTHVVVLQATSRRSKTVLLGTALINVSSPAGGMETVRALVDPCSDATLVSEHIAQRLRLQRDLTSVPVTGVGGLSSQAKGSASIIVMSRTDCNLSFHIDAWILSHLSSYVPKCLNQSTNWDHLQGLELADPNFDSDQSVDIILGADIYPSIILAGLRKGPIGSPVAQQTIFGWILTCSTLQRESLQPRAVHHVSINSDATSLNRSLERFWEIESIPSPALEATMSPDDSACLKHFEETTARDSSGRFIVRLPFKTKSFEFPRSFEIAKSSFFRLENRLSKNDDLRNRYVEFMSEFENLNHIELLSISESSQEFSQLRDSYFIPHHGIFKNPGKLRVVFNASAKSANNASLNSTLHTGPPLQSSIVSIFIRWRLFRFVYQADIEKMYRQILLHPDDRKFQRILWRSDPRDPLSIYQICTVIYGVASSAFQAIQCLRQLATLEGKNHPLSVSIITENMYVDDALFGSDSLEQAIELAKDFTKLLLAGGFPLRKWSANHPDLLAHIPPSWLNDEKEISQDSLMERKSLGLTWCPATDQLSYRFTCSPCSGELTKRKILSMIASIFDPLGLLSPVVVRCKIFMQGLWKEPLQWDDAVSDDLVKEWDAIFSDLSLLNGLSVPRWLGYSPDLALEIHGFSDASESAMCATIYFRILRGDETHVMLVVAKTKVAPVNSLTPARLELCAAYMLAKLARSLIDSLGFSHHSTHLWSDSKVTLAWIQSKPYLWQIFIAHRVAEIQRIMSNAHWHHIDGIENPADLGTRGVSTDKFINESSLWWSGPDFLSEPNPYPTSQELFDDEICSERRRACHVSMVEVSPEWDLVVRYSSFCKLLRVTAWCLRFINNVRLSIARSPQFHAPFLMPHELQFAVALWTRLSQLRSFPHEYLALSKGHSISPKSRLLRLNPIFDPCTECIRVGGRLKHASLSYDHKYPFIMESDSHFSRLLISECHLRSLHGGVQLTLSLTRESHWLIHARVAVRKFIRSCLTCVRFRALPLQQQMGNLISPRVNRSFPFAHVGIDYAGPIQIRASGGRGQRSYKGYIAVFVCMATKAVHLEAVSSYDTIQFLNAFKRFIARRGLCSDVYSDCGTNFVGADNELKAMFEQSSSKISKIVDSLANQGVNWHFNPPAAPHFGGLWEAAVKSTKHHLRRVIGNSTLTFEEISTLLATIESVLNSRPLYAISDDPSDLEVLTPAHFLLGRPSLSLPEESYLNSPLKSLKRWQQLIQMRDDFWSQWRSCYLHTLQTRNKWTKIERNVEVGSLVLISSEKTPPSKWPLARVIKVFPGDDYLTRAVSVRTATSELTRPIVKLVLLPVDPNP